MGYTEGSRRAKNVNLACARWEWYHLLENHTAIQKPKPKNPVKTTENLRRPWHQSQGRRKAGTQRSTACFTTFPLQSSGPWLHILLIGNIFPYVTESAQPCDPRCSLQRKLCFSAGPEKAGRLPCNLPRWPFRLGSHAPCPLVMGFAALSWSS